MVETWGNKRDNTMRITYKRLWKLLIDREMMKKDLLESSKISTVSMAKLGKNQNVTTDVLLKICTALHCDISDIMEVVEDEDLKNDEQM